MTYIGRFDNCVGRGVYHVDIAVRGGESNANGIVADLERLDDIVRGRVYHRDCAICVVGHIYVVVGWDKGDAVRIVTYRYCLSHEVGGSCSRARRRKWNRGDRKDKHDSNHGQPIGHRPYLFGGQPTSLIESGTYPKNENKICTNGQRIVNLDSETTGKL